jgi:uncharacterized protein YbjT (DUF2867 family)
MKKIAIIGSTGMLGQPVTKAFITSGFEVSLLVRDVDKAKELFGAKVRIVKGDLKDTSSLKELINGQDGVYLNLSVEQSSGINDFQAERDGLKNILQVAKSSNIKRIGYLSSLVQFYTGVNWWVLDIKKAAVKNIKQSRLNYSIFYASTFMESFDKGAYQQGNSINLAGISKYRMYLIAGADYGRQVVRAFGNDNGNNEYVVQGQDGYTADDAAKIFIEHHQRNKIKVIKLPFGLLKFLGRLSRKFNYAAHIVDVLNNYEEKFEAENTWRELGKPQIRFIDYAKNA